MLHIQKILFPVDFSRRCSAAAWLVAAMARHFNAKVTVLHVMQIPPAWYGDLAAAELALMKEREVRLDAFLQNEFHRFGKVESIVDRGEPAHVITEHAGKQNVDLIMMPTHGHGTFRRLLLGSVTTKVLHDAECPVWTDVHDESSFVRAGCESVLCAVDLREEAVPSIQWAAKFANSYGAQLNLIHAIPALDGPTPPGEVRFRNYHAEHAREYIAALQRKAGTTARVCIEGGKIAETVRNGALQHAADLVVIGQGCMRETLGRLRSNAYAIIRESPCPVVRI